MADEFEELLKNVKIEEVNTEKPAKPEKKGKKPSKGAVKAEAAAAKDPSTEMVPVVGAVEVKNGDGTISNKKLHRFGKYPAARVGDTTPLALMQRIATELPVAHELPLYYQAGETVDFTEAEGFKGTFVEFQGRTILVDVPTDRYTLVQHQEAFAPYIESLAQHHGTDRIRAAMTYNAREAFVYASFPDKLTITPDDGQPIELGVVMHNSLDRSSAVTFDGYGLRRACMNMFGFSELLGHDSIRHTEAAPEALTDLLDKFSFSLDDLTATINGARGVPVKEEQVKEWFRKVFGDKNQMKFLASFRNQEQTAWGLFNAVTDVVTHDPAYSGHGQFTQLMDAEPILWTPEERMIEIFEESAAANREKDEKKALLVEIRQANKGGRKVA